MRDCASPLRGWRSSFQMRAGDTWRRPLLALVPPLLLGLLCGAARPGHQGPILILAVALLVRVVYCLRRRRPSILPPVLLWSACGYLAIQPWLAPSLPDDHVVHFADGAVWTVTGVVDEAPQLQGYRYRARVQVVGVERAGAVEARRARGDLRLTWSADAGALQRGDTIRFSGRLRRMRGFGNPGGFDYARYMAFRGLLVSAYARRHTLAVTAPAEPPGRWTRLAAARLQTATAMVRRAADGRSRSAVGPLLETLLLGRRQALTAEMREPYQRCGVAHLLAISGLHLGAVGGFAFSAFALLLSFVPALRWRGWVAGAAAGLALGPVLAYALLAGLPVSTQRAAVMIAALLAAILVQRRTDGFNNLALAALAILVAHPPALFSISFQLSFAAVAAILFGLRHGEGWWRRGPPGPLNLRHRLRLLALVSTLAYAGTAPLVAHYFNTLSVVALPVNLLLVPWVSVLILPAGLMAVLLALLALPGAELLLAWCAHHLALLDALVSGLAGWPWAAIDTVTPSGPELVLGYALLALIPWLRRSLQARWATIALLCLLAGDAAYWTHRRFFSPHLRVTAIDVGQGGSSLVELPGGRTLLIDGGGFSDNRVFDVGRRVLTPLLGRLKIRTLDLVILTHPNSDHLNGLLYLLEHFEVGEFWRNADTPATVGFAELLRRLDGEKIVQPPFETLRRQRRWANTRLDILHPARDYHRGRPGPTGGSNDHSLVVKLTHGAHSFLWPGDLEARAEATLVSQYRAAELQTSVLFAPHHGSRSSSSGAWVAAVNPREVVFSVGWQNPYHFPHPMVAARYREHGARLWRTDRDGAVVFLSDGRELTIRTTRRSPADTRALP